MSPNIIEIYKEILRLEEEGLLDLAKVLRKLLAELIEEDERIKK